MAVMAPEAVLDELEFVPQPTYWWHFYGREWEGDDTWYAVDNSTGERKPLWMALIAGQSPIPPDDPVVRKPVEFKPAGLPVPYITSWDHEPTEEEVAAVTPEKYRDGPEVWRA